MLINHRLLCRPRTCLLGGSHPTWKPAHWQLCLGKILASGQELGQGWSSSPQASQARVQPAGVTFSPSITPAPQYLLLQQELGYWVSFLMAASTCPVRAVVSGLLSPEDFQIMLAALCWLSSTD